MSLGAAIAPTLWIVKDFETGYPAGVQINHPSVKDGSPCATYAGWMKGANRRDPKEMLWTVTSQPPPFILPFRPPLTLSPSVVCASCGLHGFVSDGRWMAV